MLAPARALTIALAFVCACHIPASTAPQPQASLRQVVERHVEARSAAILAELRDLLRVPNVAADTANIRRNAELLADRFNRRGFATELLETGGNPLVYGELRVPGASRTLLIYLQYDGQPVDAREWRQPNPFEPVLRDGRVEDGARDIDDWSGSRTDMAGWRVYGRSASDAKGPIAALLAALDALRAGGLAPAWNLRVIMDGDEERGSPHLVPAIAKYGTKLAADLMVVLDGPLHPSGRPTLLFGARGILAFHLTVFGPSAGVHSGNYGNWVPNPALRLAQLLSSMKDDEGNVTVAGFYDRMTPLTPEDRAAVEAVPEDAARLRSAFGIATSERPGESIQLSLQRPALNVRGLASAFVGPEARTIIPDRAVAAIDVRLIRETPPDVMLSLIREHVRRQGYLLLDRDPDIEERRIASRIARLDVEASIPAFRTSSSHPLAAGLVNALTSAWGEPPIRIRTAGGTVPIAPFIDALGFPAVIVPIVNFDNNQHAADENLELGAFYRGITTIAAILRSAP